VAAKGVLGDLNPLVDGPCRSLADNGARVPKILPAAELEGSLTGPIVAMPPVGGAAVGDDVEEAQELAVESPTGGDDAGQEGVFESGISGPVAVHLGASGALEDPAWLRVAKRPVSANVSQVISAEFMVDCDVENQVAMAAEVHVLAEGGCHKLAELRALWCNRAPGAKKSRNAETAEKTSDGHKKGRFMISMRPV